MHVFVFSEGRTTPKTASKEQELFPGVAFASDMNVSLRNVCVLMAKIIHD